MCLFIILFNYWIAILSISDVSGLIIFYGQILTFIAGIYGWSRDLVRETIKKCNMVSVNVFIFYSIPKGQWLGLKGLEGLGRIIHTVPATAVNL